MSRVVIFPVGKEASAASYAAAVNAHYAANYEPGGNFTLIRIDAFGQSVTGYYGDILNGDPFVEPAEMVPYRADGVIHDFAVWLDA